MEECESFAYYDELVYLYSKTGQMKRALYLIIDRLQNVPKAIEFAKEQDDDDLWEDLLNYSMDKPRFIRGLLEQAGTSIDPIRLVQRIPEGLEIQGLREGLTHMMKEHEIQYSISSGVARVLRSEVAAAQNELRGRQRRGIKFEVVAQAPETETTEDEKKQASATATEKTKDKDNDDDDDDATTLRGTKKKPAREPEPGHCAQCHEQFTEYEMEALLGYACGHVYHVSHLMELLHPGKGGRDVDLGYGSGAGEDDDEPGRYTVGVKVMRARLLRDKVKGGCPLCHEA